MALDSPVQRDGDRGFIGFASRLNPLTLPPGMLQLSENMRLDRGVAQVRKGATRLATGLSIADPPLVLPFTLSAAPNEPIVRNVYTGGIYGAAAYASAGYQSADEYIVLAGPDRAFLYRQGVTPIPDKTYPSSPSETIEPTDTVSVIQALDRLYILREADPTVSGWGTQTTNGSGISVTGTAATVYVTGHGYTAGMRVRIEGGANAALDGHEYDVESSNLAPDSFEITVPDGTASDASSGIRVRRTKPPIYWDGGSGNFVRSPGGVPAGLPATYKTMRSIGWASYINNRLIIPDGRDQVMISDISDPNTYDPFWASFRAGDGGSDFVVAVHPWVENAALVFCRKSIWLAEINQFASTDGTDFSIDTPISRLTQLTDEIGCSARNSIVTAGNFVFFLSDAGVYRLDTKLDLKLRGDTKPLSDPIADLFANVNAERVGKAFALWHDNRYLLALPTTSDPADGNDLVVCWNALNEAWEYRDTYSIGVDQILVGDYSERRRVFNARFSGSLYLLDDKNNGKDDTAAGTDGYTVTGKIKTRRYDFGEMHSKRFLRTIADVVIPDGATVTTKLTTINPDKIEEQIGSLTNSTGTSEDYNMKSPVRYKAHAAEITYEATNGRPEIRSASIEASPKSMPATLTRNAA